MIRTAVRYKDKYSIPVYVAISKAVSPEIMTWRFSREGDVKVWVRCTNFQVNAFESRCQARLIPCRYKLFFAKELVRP